MKWINLLHFYQPYNQQQDILDRIVHESYLPILRGMKSNPASRAVVNITASLTQLLQKSNYHEVLNLLSYLGANNQIEFTGSAAYHAFLPLLPETEIIRQITINDGINSAILGKSYNHTGFFSPEMAINDKVLKIISNLGYKWVSVPEIAVSNITKNNVFELSNLPLRVFVRNKRVSSLILSGIVKTAEELLNETKDIKNDLYWFTVMDAETFGHHRIGHDKFLLSMYKNKDIISTTVNEFLKTYVKDPAKISVRASTWTNDEQDFWLDKERTKPSEGKSFILWKDPENPIHSVQWEFVNFALNQINSYSDKTNTNWISARNLMDIALASDQFWWASAKPWWSLEMIEQGAYETLSVVNTLKKSTKSMQRAKRYYNSILDLAFYWQRSGYIRHKHLESSATFMQKPLKERTPDEWFNQLILEFEDQMNKCAKNRQFEKAIKWRDALYKIQSGFDIYDVLHVVDDLWSERNIPQLKPFLQHTWEEFSDFAQDNFKGVSNKKDFERLKG